MRLERTAIPTGNSTATRRLCLFSFQRLRKIRFIFPDHVFQADVVLPTNDLLNRCRIRTIDLIQRHNRQIRLRQMSANGYGIIHVRLPALLRSIA